MSGQTAKDKAEIEQGVHTYSNPDGYIPPEEPLLQERLEWFRDQKLGLMMHWGAYSQLGLIEGWPLCDQEMAWSRRQVDWEVSDE